MKQAAARNLSKLDEKFLQQFGFRFRKTTPQKIVNYLFMPKDASSLAFTRIAFGIIMFFDVPDERGGAEITSRWGNPNMCHFPLLPFLRPVSLPYMAMVYAVLWFAALGIALGFKYRYSCVAFIICYWYLILIEKNYWNNHTYLFGLVAILLSFTEADCYWSIDVCKDATKKKETVPYWNYFILKYQFFILYFMAGVKKLSPEWLAAYSVSEICRHWVFDIFKPFLTLRQINKYIVHWFISVFDLTVAMWMMWSQSRNIAVFFCVMFHLMNMRLFSIGMFPWLCLATIPLFYPFDWPKRTLDYICKFKDNIREIWLYISTFWNINPKDQGNKEIHVNCAEYDRKNELQELKHKYSNVLKEMLNNEKVVLEPKDVAAESQINSVSTLSESDIKTDKKIEYVKEADSAYEKKITVFIFFYMIWQAFMPFSHFITQGYNTWTDGLYGYSWDMMVYDWYDAATIVRVVDHNQNQEFYFDNNNSTPSKRWASHADMAYQYAHCVRDKLQKYNEIALKHNSRGVSDNISIHFDIWISLNQRFHQRVYDPHVDMLKVEWSPFQKPSYVMPLLEEAAGRRDELYDITERFRSLSNDSDVQFYAEFPGYSLDRFVSADMQNVVLSVMNGTALYIPDVDTKPAGQSYKLINGETIEVDSNTFHKVMNIGDSPLYFMYIETCTNCTDEVKQKPKLPIVKEFMNRLYKMLVFVQLLVNNIILLTCNQCAEHEL